MNLRGSDGSSRAEALTSFPHTMPVEGSVVDGKSKGRFSIRCFPVIEREGEGSESPPKSNPDIDHETRQG